MRRIGDQKCAEGFGMNRRWFFGALAALATALPFAAAAGPIKVLSRSDWGAVGHFPDFGLTSPWISSFTTQE
jgi:hypothetical protein